MSGTTGWGVPGPGTPGIPGGPAWGYVPRPPKPGVIPLQPLGFGDIISGVFGTLKRYAKPVFVPLLLTTLGSLLLFGILAAVSYGPLHSIYDDLSRADRIDRTPSNAQAATLFTFGIVAVLLFLICSLACYLVASTTCTVVLRHAVLGRRVTVRQVWSEARPHLWRVAADSVLLFAGSFVLLCASMVPSMVLGSGPGAAALSLLVLPAFGFAIYCAVRLVLVVPVVVLENQRPMEALRRAWTLNEGAWWRSLGIPYVINLIGSFAGQIILVPFIFVAMIPVITTISASPDGTTPGPGGLIGAAVVFYGVVLIGAALVSVLVLPLIPLTNGLLYMDRRIRRESLDLALAAQADRDRQTPQAPTWAPPTPQPSSPEPSLSPVDLQKPPPPPTDSPA
ncbi:putative membrane protein [Streptacidiphilus sp. MAP12-16]|uniref:DUF7544 domain-containing protein n=1 Tax=Streptacidiphilus sp. MAP12-16 TaxID=3156300 RepID=UPI0035147DF6